MYGIKLNKQILEAIRAETEDDPIMKQFIKEVILGELEHPGQWWFKESYKKWIRKYSHQWGSKQ